MSNELSQVNLLKVVQRWFGVQVVNVRMICMCGMKMNGVRNMMARLLIALGPWC